MTRLLTLGTLSAEGSSFGREKPLLLLAYLALSGVQLRRDVARRFWPDASSPMNSLSVALGQLRKAVPGAVWASETQVSTAIQCDALDFQQAAQAGDLAAARKLYRGAFLAGLTLDELGEELEEWVMQTREELAEMMRELLLREAKRQFASDPKQAANLASEAYALAGAAPLAPARLRELHTLLIAARHPDAARLAQEAAELGLHFQAASLPLPAVPLLGRQAELKRLQDLQPGETLWLRGAAGLGKTALLRAAAAQGGTLLSGRGGHPFQTLLPLAPEPAPTSEAAWLDFLIRHPAPLLLDDWEAADPETRRVLLGLARSHAGGPLSVSSREKPPATLPEMVLRPIAAEHLTREQAERSAGIPALLSAQTPADLADAYAQLLSPLTPRARQLLACLGIQNSVNRQATCAALALSAEQMAELLEGLGRACLLDGTKPVAPFAVRAWLDTQPSLETEVLTLLAPHLPAADALPLYLRAHELTGASDFTGFQEVLEGHCRTLLEGGRDNEAEVLLAKHALTETNKLLHGRALDALGRYPEALKLLDGLEKTPLVEAYRGRSMWKLGLIDEAYQSAEIAMSGDLNARALGHTLRGGLALTTKDYLQAKESFRKSQGLFLLLGDEYNQLNALCNLAVATISNGEDIDHLIDDLLEKSKTVDTPRILLNIGWIFERRDNFQTALEFAERAAIAAEKLGQQSVAAGAWTNVGVAQHKLGHVALAASAYQQAIHLARRTKQIRTLALALGNLAELQESLPLIEEALTLLENAGQDDLVAYFEQQRQAFRGRSGGG